MSAISISVERCVKAGKADFTFYTISARALMFSVDFTVYEKALRLEFTI